MWVKTGPPIGEPSAFKREMGAFANKFRGFDQHDSQEFLQYALEGMHNELNRAPPLPPPKLKPQPPPKTTNEEEEEEQEGEVRSRLVLSVCVCVCV